MPYVYIEYAIRIMTGHHGPYGMGDRRATRTYTKCRNAKKPSKTYNIGQNTDCRLQFAYIKQEYRVVANNNVAANFTLIRVLTARHGLGWHYATKLYYIYTT